MMRSYSYLNSARKIIELYNGSIPLAAWLKDYFKSNKKFGSRDRKEISHLCYCYFRLGKTFAQMELQERFLLGLFLGSESSNLVLQELKPEWNDQVHFPIGHKLATVNATAEAGNVFPLVKELSEQIDAKAFSSSHLLQPSLFLRIRPGKHEKILQALKEARLSYEVEGNTVRIPNGTRIENLVAVDREAVVQDLNSQKTLDALQLHHLNDKQQSAAWDCCSASGGKSILFHDLFPEVHITVSDIRESILANLRKRFDLAGIQDYDGFVADLSSNAFALRKKFDIIICDAPCSGSGTWGRTPEQLIFFDSNKINHYTSLQKNICANAARNLKAGGSFVYITCSVFSAENEQVVEYIQANTNLKLESSQYLKGYDQKADTLFVALLRL